MVSDKELLASAKPHAEGYEWPDGSVATKYSSGRWSVCVPGQGRRIETIFHPSAEAAARALFDAGYGPAKCQPEQNCDNCLRCHPERDRMIVCQQCGNKRCPKATWHGNQCTGSNEPGQPGSDYSASFLPAKPKLPPELRQALEWMDDDILPGEVAFGNVYAPLRAWCEAAYDCSHEPPIPPKPPALEPFEIENGSYRAWAFTEGASSFWGSATTDSGPVCYPRSSGWRRVEPKP